MKQKKDSLRREVLARIAAAATDAEAGREVIGAAVRDGIQSALDRRSLSFRLKTAGISTQRIPTA